MTQGGGASSDTCPESERCPPSGTSEATTNTATVTATTEAAYTPARRSPRPPGPRRGENLATSSQASGIGSSANGSNRRFRSSIVILQQRAQAPTSVAQMHMDGRSRRAESLGDLTDRAVGVVVQDDR